MSRKRKLTDTSDLKNKLLKRLQKAKKDFNKHHPHAVEFLTKKNIEIGNIREHAKRTLASTTVAGAIILAAPAINHITAPIAVRHAELSQFERETLFSSDVSRHIEKGNYKITSEQEEEINKLIKDYWDIDAYPILDGKRLNHSYGLIGAEQHLPRFPGDNIYEHDKLRQGGITPARGAWGYFAKSKSDMTADIVLKEKYYVAVQTLYLADWNSNLTELKKWYKFRKVIVINPYNGRTVVADIADAGPANWTSKHFGGSPELMQHLDLYKGMMKGEVILFFVDDPENNVPLGPVKYN